MANEHIVRAGGLTAYDFTVADGTGIEKGALLKGTDPRTAIISSAAGDVLAGIAAVEKVASDGQTRISVLRNNAIVAAYASGDIIVGNPIVAADTSLFPNFVKTAVATASGDVILGTALETAANGEQFEYWLNVGAGGFHLS